VKFNVDERPRSPAALFEYIAKCGLLPVRDIRSITPALPTMIGHGAYPPPPIQIGLVCDVLAFLRGSESELSYFALISVNTSDANRL
jgi:hypothetical protein